jgi:ABC-type sugar transport system ATPase subunit
MPSQHGIPLLQVTGLGKSYGTVRALRDVDLAIYPGSVLALLGENGAGKSTFISVVSGATVPTTGRIEFDGAEVTLSQPLDAARLGVQVVHQEPKLTNEASIAENIFLARYASSGAFRGVRPRAMAREAQQHLERLGLASEIPAVTTQTGRLSSAQRQLVAIAKAMASNARLLFLDEPNSSLTPRETTQLWQLVRTLRDDGVAVVVVSHRLKELYEVIDRVAILRDGRLVLSGTPDDIPIHAAVQLMAGRDATLAEAARVRRSHHLGAEVLRTDGVTTRDVHDVSLSVRAGEVLGLAGLVGSGRTEIGRAICGVDALLSGEVMLDGKPVHFGSPREALAAGVVMTSEERRQAVFSSHDVAFNIVASDLVAMSRFGTVTREMERSIAERWVAKLSLRGTTSTPITSLSGGNQQKALIARALAVKPRVVILDEPTHGIDVATKAEIAQLVAELAETGVAIIFISSEVEELIGIADRIAVIRHGAVAQEATGADGIALVAAALGESIPSRHPEPQRGEPQ